MMARSILFVDDSPLARAVAERALGAQGLDVHALGSTSEAEAIDPSQLSAAILDLELGDGNGADLAARLRAVAPDLPIAFLTAAPSSRLVESAARFGPVFSKGNEVDEAMRWALDRVNEPR